MATSLPVASLASVRMRLISWNVNSVRQRLARMVGVLQRHQPDVLCLQETKVEDHLFPSESLVMQGYRAAVYGQKTYNGVAFISRNKAEDVQRGFDGDPVPDHARVISGKFGDVNVVDVYVVNGKSTSDPMYEVKLEWLRNLQATIAARYSPDDPLVILGDYNIAPTDIDVHDPEAWRERILCSTPERQALQRFLDWGMTDLFREVEPEDAGFTWWDYRNMGFPRNEGLRIDLALGTKPVLERLENVFVDREERKESSGEGKPSDHAPLVVDIADA